MNRDSIIAAASLVLEPASLWYLCRWPVFSVTSFHMVSDLMRQEVHPRTVIDVGANIGQFAVAWLRLQRAVRVYSFEAIPECVRRLNALAVRVNNWTVFPFAVGGESGNTTLHVNRHSQSSSILALGDLHRAAFPGEQETGVIDVPLRTLDAVLENLELERPVLLKLDVQGYEAYVLQGASQLLRRIDYVILESSFQPLYEGERVFRDLLGTMESLGFTFLRPVGLLRNPQTRQIIQIDALFSRGQNRQTSGIYGDSACS